jgi:hypothetical protein
MEAVEVRQLPPEMSTRFANLNVRLQPTTKAWVQQQAGIEKQKPAPDLAALQTAIGNRFSAGNNRAPALNQAEIESMMFAVLMQATSEMDQDLRQIMDEVNSVNKSKQQLRDLLGEVQKEAASSSARPTAPCDAQVCRSLAARISQIEAAAPKSPRMPLIQAPSHPTFGDLKPIQDGLKSQVDSMNEMSEITSLRLQMTMDRRAKFMEALSNIMKKMNSTSDSLVQNLK